MVYLKSRGIEYFSLANGNLSHKTSRSQTLLSSLLSSMKILPWGVSAIHIQKHRCHQKTIFLIFFIYTWNPDTHAECRSIKCAMYATRWRISLSQSTLSAILSHTSCTSYSRLFVPAARRMKLVGEKLGGDRDQIPRSRNPCGCGFSKMAGSELIVTHFQKKGCQVPLDVS